MRKFAIVTAIVAGSLVSGGAHGQSPATPYAFTCEAYLAAQQGQDRGQANAMLYWATGYMQGRLGSSMPTANFSAESFDKDIRDVHAAMMQICPNVPDMAVATFMANLAADFEKSATPQQ